MRKRLAAGVGLAVGFVVLWAAAGALRPDPATLGPPAVRLVSWSPHDVVAVRPATTRPPGQPANCPPDDRQELDGVLPLVAWKTVDPQEGLPAYGLGEGATAIVFEGPRGRTVALRVGSANVDRTGRYVQVEGDNRLHLVTTQAGDALLALVGCGGSGSSTSATTQTN